MVDELPGAPGAPTTGTLGRAHATISRGQLLTVVGGYGRWGRGVKGSREREVVKPVGANPSTGDGDGTGEGRVALESDEDLGEGDHGEVEPRDFTEACGEGGRVGIAVVGAASVAREDQVGVEVLFPLLVDPLWGAEL